MLRPIVEVFALILLVSQVPNIFGKLTTLRGPTSNNKKNVICLSEDDGGALVWNADLTYTYYKNAYIIDQYKKNFVNSCDLYSTQIDCKLNNLKGCLEWWNRNNWTLTNSIDTPMGLVFDQRWEAFKEYTYNATTVYNVTLYNPKTIVLPFSVRAIKDVHILICDKNYMKKFCYWVIIGGWENTMSVIRKCPKGVPPIGEYPDENSECAKTRTYFNHIALDPYEWRSFILTWDSDTRNVSLYDSHQLIMTYRDMDKYIDTKFTSKIFIKSSSSMSIRYHIYNYLYTSTPNAVLTSNAFPMNINAICLQMLIGLCAECDADVSLYTSDDEILQTITVKGSSVAAVHGLPMWRSVKIAVNTTTYSYSGLKIVVTPKLIFSNPNPVWAIANIRQCPLYGCLRESAMYIYRDYGPSWRKINGFWPNVTCQKLFYEEQSVVNVFNNIDLHVEQDVNNCSFGYIGPACKLNCNTALETTTYCKNVKICNENGCACAPGYKDSKCNAFCDDNFYGHGCKKKCGSCFQDEQCDPVSGVCSGGCKIMGNYFYAPPLCQIGIDNPSKLEITFRNQTTITAAVPFKWEEKYEEVELLYTFNIEQALSKNFTDQLEWKRIIQNSTKLVGNFQNLKSGTNYLIQCIISINQSLVYGDWKVVNVFCDPIENFHVTPRETSLEIIMDESENQLHPCPIKTYDVLLKNNDNPNDQRIYESIPYFPFTLSNLTAYTSYNVTILKSGRILFFKEVCTLEGVLLEILSLRASVLSSTSVTLFWESPSQSNGVIKEYVIQVTITKYFGCNDISLPSSNYIIIKRTNKTEITLSGLHAYAKYTAKVTARNLRHTSRPAITMFSLPASMVPAVTFSLPKWENWTLSWSPPKDCTAILGPLSVANVEIRGISEAVQNFSVIKNTKRDKINLRNSLYGAEQYVAKIFALRDFRTPKNISVYEEYKFETLPTEPPAITSLEVVEIENPETIYLRWQSPRPPFNGILRGYDIIICSYDRVILCKVIEVNLNETCGLWDNYICKSIRYTNDTIQVVAYNMGVSHSSPPVNVTMGMLRNTTPDPPNNLTFTTHSNGIIDFKWLHPWRTGVRIRYFRILIKEISSTLRSRVTRSFNNTHDFLVTNYLRSYSLQLYLLPSTQYNISIQTVTKTNELSKTNTLPVQTPSSIDLHGELEASMQESDSIILLHIPKVLNDTCNSIIYIGIIGPDICKQRAKLSKDLLVQAGEERIEYVSQVVNISTNELSGEVYTIGEDQFTNCSLKNGEKYEIMVIITERNSSDERFILTRKTSFYFGGHSSLPRNEVWVISTILIFTVVCAAFYFYKK